MAPVVLGLGRPPAPPAELTLEGSATTENGWQHSPFNVNLPSGIQAGELLLVFFGVDDDPNGGDNRTYSLSGWTQLWQTATAEGNGLLRGAAWARVATGSEGGSVSVVGSGSGSESTGIALRIGGWDDSGSMMDAIAISSSADGFSSSPNPPAVSPAWGAGAPSLFIAVNQSASSWSGSSVPSGYDRRINAISNGSGSGGGNQFNSTQILAFKDGTAASEDPGAFTLNNSFAWLARTVAIKGH